jgi:hypothetical protein
MGRSRDADADGTPGSKLFRLDQISSARIKSLHPFTYGSPYFLNRRVLGVVDVAF